MPNCDFYATPEDHASLLDWLFADGACHVYEHSSDFEQPLKQFHAAGDVLAQFQRRYPNGRPWHSVYLQLYVLGAGPAFSVRRIALDPDACDGATFRYAAEGWGLIQLYLSAAKEDGLSCSHTNHHSARRAEVWAPVTGVEPGPGTWDFRQIGAFSSRLNYQIRKRAVGKLGSRPVLPGALELWGRGTPLSPYQPGRDVLQVKRG